MVRKNNFKSAGAIVLGMHDALVSLTGLISGLAIAIYIGIVYRRRIYGDMRIINITIFYIFKSRGGNDCNVRYRGRRNFWIQLLFGMREPTAIYAKFF